MTDLERTQQRYPAGTAVRFNQRYLDNLSEKERKRYLGRMGVIRGYRIQNDPSPKPIVHFPKFKGFKEEVYYEMPWANIELVSPAAR